MSDLGPIIAAMLGPMLLFVAASMRYQHVDSTKTRELIAESAKENRELIEKNRDLLRTNHAEISSSLADARERLARIEGYLRISPPPQQGSGDGDNNAKAA